jgi:hypothetical protein
VPQWEILVTQGHVRAARWRNAVPFVMAAGIAAITIGVAVNALVPEAATSTRVFDAKNSFVAAQRSAIAAFIHDKASIAALPENAESAFTPSTAQAAVQELLQSLGATRRLPKTVVRQSPDEFWQGSWRPGAILAVQKERTVLIGYFVDGSGREGANDPAPPVLQRAYGILRRDAEGKWSIHCLQMIGALPCDGNAVEPTYIPATMRALIPSSAFNSGRQS